jgi:VWA domain-containing protein
MLRGMGRMVLAAALCSWTPLTTWALSERVHEQQKKGNERPVATKPTSTEALPEATPPDDQEIETLKTTTDLVTVPVIVTDINGIYIPDLKQSEFGLTEDGVKQEIAFFRTVSAPFHVVLMLDTSASTQEKLRAIQNAAIAFVDQLQKADRLKVISFDDKVRDLNDFTSDRALLRSAILQTRSGYGTKFYDAFDLALTSVRPIPGRKAIVIFTDGVDYRSDDATFDGTLRFLDEDGVIVYPIRFNTRAETERIARGESGQTAQLPTIGVVRPPPGTTVPTFPGEGPNTIPTSEPGRKTGPFGLPLPEEILRRRRDSSRDRDRDRIPQPEQRLPGDIEGDSPNGRTDPRTSTTGRENRPEDAIGMMLDSLYTTADGYLKALADKSGGRLLRADNVSLLPEAFARIAGELRTQYSLGYYPLNRSRDDQYRRIKVTSSRNSVIIRARPGYRQPKEVKRVIAGS